MIKLTDDMRHLIDPALANGMPCLLGTASPDGQPNISYRGSIMVFDDESLAYWDRGKRQSIQDILDNPKVCVLFRHPQQRLIWRFFGDATVHAEGALRAQVLARVVQPELDRDPERRGVAVVIRVNQVLSATGEILQERTA